MSRSVTFWVGKTDDSKVPDTVRLRIFRRENGVCYLSGARIEAGSKWELEHRVPLSMGGKHAETNLFPALVEPHKAKTAAEAKGRAKADAVAKRNLGITAPKQKIQSAGFRGPDKETKRAAKNAFYHELVRRPMFVGA